MDFIRALIISGCNGEKILKSVKKNYRYCKNKSGPVFFGYRGMCSKVVAMLSRREPCANTLIIQHTFNIINDQYNTDGYAHYVKTSARFSQKTTQSTADGLTISRGPVEILDYFFAFKFLHLYVYLSNVIFTSSADANKPARRV